MCVFSGGGSRGAPRSGCLRSVACAARLGAFTPGVPFCPQTPKGSLSTFQTKPLFVTLPFFSFTNLLDYNFFSPILVSCRQSFSSLAFVFTLIFSPTPFISSPPCFYYLPLVFKWESRMWTGKTNQLRILKRIQSRKEECEVWKSGSRSLRHMIQKVGVGEISWEGIE